MIVCHEHRFIFVKTRKTAGTSIEIALAGLCGPRDVITRISPQDEKTRQELGFRGPQNDRISMSRYTGQDWVRLLRRGRPARFYNHATALEIQDHVEPTVWNSYFKFCFERNPWDKVVSAYYWDCKGGYADTLANYVRNGRANKWSAFDQYSIRGDIAVDEVFRYEDLGGELARLYKRLGAGTPPQLPRAKGNTRSDRRHYSELLGDEERERIARLFAREIAHFGYSFGAPA
jgi:hypothetical protein